MTDSKMVGLPELITPAIGDELLITDVSDTTDDITGSSKFTLLSTLSTFFEGLILTASKIKAALGITTLSGSNTGDETKTSIETKLDTDLVTPTSTTVFTNKDLTSPTNIIGSWNFANETWEYVSVDDPTGIFRVNADITGKYSAGMRIKFTNATNVIYGIITVVGAYTGGYTNITFLHEIDPTDSLALVLMANSAITANYYSTQKAPFGFPLESTKWTVKYKATSSFSQSNPVQNQWYNTDSLSIPIGNWNVSWSGIISATSAVQAVAIRVSGTLSSTNNSEDDIDFSVFQGLNAYTDASNALTVLASVSLCKNITLTSKTIKYFNIKTSTASATALVTVHTTQPIIIKAICAYL